MYLLNNTSTIIDILNLQKMALINSTAIQALCNILCEKNIISESEFDEVVHKLEKLPDYSETMEYIQNKIDIIYKFESKLNNEDNEEVMNFVAELFPDLFKGNE